MTIETKKVSVAEAIAIIERLNYRNNTFVYRFTTREDNADIKYRHFDGYKENGEKDGFALIEIVVDGKLAAVRFFNLFRDITVDLLLSDFTLDYSRFDQVIDANDAEIELANCNEREEILSTPLVNVKAQKVAVNAEIKLANSTLELKTGEQLKSLAEMEKAFAKHCERTDELLRRAAIKCKARELEGKISSAKCLLKNVNLANVTDPELLKMANDALSDMENAKIELAAIKTNNPDIFNTGKKPATAYQPQTQWENPHDFTITGDLSDRNINGRIIAANSKGETTLTDNQKLAKQITDNDDFNAKLAALQANVADAKANLAVKQAALDTAQEEFLQADAELEVANRAIIQLGDAKAAELQAMLPANFEIIFDFFEHNFIVSTINGKSRQHFETFDTPEQVKDAINFGQHLLTLKKAQEDAYPEEVKELNRNLAQSNLEAPHMLLKIYNKDFHTGSFCGVKLNKLHVKSFVTDKIHFNICYATEPLECYDTFEEVTDAINHFKDAIMHGATKFKFPTSDELNPPTTSASKMTVEELQKAFWSGHLPPAFETTIRAALKKATDDKRARLKKSGRTRCRLVVPQVNAILAKLLESGELNQAEQPQEPTRKQINDSLIRALETNLLNIQAHLRNLDINAAVAELNLYHICDNALLRKEVA